MIKCLKSAAATIAFLQCCTNAIPVCSSVCIPVEQNDCIYDNVNNSSSPIVIEKYRLIFFPVPKVSDTLFLTLLRRMMGLQTWQSLGIDLFDGLARLSDFSIEQATDMMNSPEYTRAIFLRDPKDRFLSIYLDQMLNYDASLEESCCLHKYQSVSNFATLIQTGNTDKQLMQMSSWIDQKFNPTLNFVGHLENAEADARSLLEKVGAWEPFGVSGWGKHGNESIFVTTEKVSDLTTTETSDSWHLMSKLFTPCMESTLELCYGVDYSIREFGLELIQIPFPIDSSRKAVPIIMFDTDGTLEHQENSSVVEYLSNDEETESESCAVDWNQTKNLEPVDRGLFIGCLAGRLFDEGLVLGLLIHWNF